MLRILPIFCVALFLISCATSSTNTFDTHHSDKSDSVMVKKYLNHFDRQSLPYLKPIGCSAKAPCSLTADFNDDGIIDFVGLYEYSGPTERIGANYVDLVILYSTKDSAQPTLQIFRYVGAIDKENQVLAKLEIQEAGEMQLPLGTITLKRPAINVRRDGQAPGTYFPTYYWTGTRFASIDKSDD